MRRDHLGGGETRQRNRERLEQRLVALDAYDPECQWPTPSRHRDLRGLLPRSRLPRQVYHDRESQLSVNQQELELDRSLPQFGAGPRNHDCYTVEKPFASAADLGPGKGLRHVQDRVDVCSRIIAAAVLPERGCTGHSPPAPHAAKGISQGRAAGRNACNFDQLLLARMLIALPAIPVNVITETVDCRSMSILALRVRGSVSVGLNAKLVVKATNR